jgi:hypothetical protein
MSIAAWWTHHLEIRLDGGQDIRIAVDVNPDVTTVPGELDDLGMKYSRFLSLQR